MAFDITLCFITPVGRVSGYLTADPITEGDLEQVTQARDAIQQNVSNMGHLSIFTRDKSPVIGVEGAEYTAMELTLPGDVIKASVMVSQIVEVKA
jgi:hypothetical protein